jgi:hypothetical protein
MSRPPSASSKLCGLMSKPVWAGAAAASPAGHFNYYEWRERDRTKTSRRTFPVRPASFVPAASRTCAPNAVGRDVISAQFDGSIRELASSKGGGGLSIPARAGHLIKGARSLCHCACLVCVCECVRALHSADRPGDHQIGLAAAARCAPLSACKPQLGEISRQLALTLGLSFGPFAAGRTCA